jgi:hypothetical protein
LIPRRVRRCEPNSRNKIASFGQMPASGHSRRFKSASAISGLPLKAAMQDRNALGGSGPEAEATNLANATVFT